MKRNPEDEHELETELLKCISDNYDDNEACLHGIATIISEYYGDTGDRLIDKWRQ